MKKSAVQVFYEKNAAAMNAALLRGEAPLSGALSAFARLTDPQRRWVGKFGKQLATGLHQNQTGTKTYTYGGETFRLATFG